MNQQQFDDLDQFLAVADATGTRFGRYGLDEHCVLRAYADHRQIPLHYPHDYTSISTALGLWSCQTDALWEANDRSGGNPAAVRACLHRMYPRLAGIIKAPVEVPA